MIAPLGPALAVAAATVGALHALAPDHWVPVAVVSRARDWSLARTARVSLLCGAGHVTVSVALGLIALLSGRAVVETVGARAGAIAGIVLIGFGAAYALWGARFILAAARGATPGPHGHAHAWSARLGPSPGSGPRPCPSSRRHHRDDHGRLDHVHQPARATTWTLFAIYCADPCVAVVPILFAAAPLSRLATLAIVIVYEAATIATMVGLTLTARAGANVVRGGWVGRYGDSAAGALIAGTGVAVALLGW